MWMTPATMTPARRCSYAIGNPSPDWTARSARATTAGTESIVAIDGDQRNSSGLSGVPHDVWDLGRREPSGDRDGGRQEGRSRSGKTGFVYVLDAATGKLIRALAGVRAAASQYTQPTADGVFMLPGANGGEEWSAHRRASRPGVCVHGGAASTHALQSALRAVGKGPALARERVRPGPDDKGGCSPSRRNASERSDRQSCRDVHVLGGTAQAIEKPLSTTTADRRGLVVTRAPYMPVRPGDRTCQRPVIVRARRASIAALVIRDPDERAPEPDRPFSHGA